MTTFDMGGGGIKQLLKYDVIYGWLLTRGHSKLPISINKLTGQ